ncbi:dihydroneopterin aldolase [Robertmurraya yapensis]|uniref:7,8-dihydroneopterin aldolase n=1 Tax=Bacillus yapensis TaxID=2492960 RepID=A0A3S0L3W2_9BACI|nr:dihydroneopterin aldolase [Bacillus yapensis]RTR26429.1 dihydroneopterin aldolase [Bacillus yapensis]TKS93700.1 dihydroneopterin aldolase [Bacillus yapensis]
MDKIYLNKMEFYGYHGVFPEENRLGQRFIVDLVVNVDLRRAGETDNLTYSINYGELYEVCKKIVEGEPFKLVEAVAEKIADTCLSQFTRAAACTVKVIKPDPPIPGHYESVAVEITRSR